MLFSAHFSGLSVLAALALLLMTNAHSKADTSQAQHQCAD